MNGKCDKCEIIKELFYTFGSDGFRLKLCGTCGAEVIKLVIKNE